jgi:small-conductance mechanosensitive channel
MASRLPEAAVNVRFGPSFLLVIGLAGVIPPASPARVAAQSSPESTRVMTVRESFPVTIWNREIARYRTSLQDLSPERRARASAERILGTPVAGNGYTIETRPGAVGDERGLVILVNGRFAMGLMEGDLDAGETLESASTRIIANLRAWLADRDEQFRWPGVLKSIAWTAAATLVALLFLTLVFPVSRRLRHRIETRRGAMPALRVGKSDIRPYLSAIQAGLVRTLTWAVAASAIYLWLTFVLRQYPYTRPWGQQLGMFLLDVFRQLGLGFLHSIPNLFIVVVIFMATRLLARLSTAFFRTARTEGMEDEIAHATQRLVVGLLWVFALVVAYPYLPGSGTAAFQGVSVFVGLMVSLGATGIVSQLLGGLVVVYSRAFGRGDYVRIGEVEGTVTEIGGLAAKVLTRRKEEVTIPHSVIVGSATTNYSRQARRDGAIVATEVSIGYDTPWRQVEALLLEAARRTTCVLRDPPGEVLKTSLSDFSVKYRLMVRITRPHERYTALSELHANILDAFNEHGVQIMSPHFEGQPDGRLVVPRSRWFTAPAAAGDGAAARSAVRADGDPSV